MYDVYDAYPSNAVWDGFLSSAIIINMNIDQMLERKVTLSQRKSQCNFVPMYRALVIQRILQPLFQQRNT
jgi:hypothetical protein